MKYIDAEKLIAEIERLNKENKELLKSGGSIGKEFLFGIGAGYADVFKIIESLQQEHPSLPSNIDEAAEKYSENILANNEDLQDAIEDAFKEGVKWMAEQGLTVDGTFHHSCGYPSVIELKTFLRDYEGADVIVNIRKK